MEHVSVESQRHVASERTAFNTISAIDLFGLRSPRLLICTVEIMIIIAAIISIIANKITSILEYLKKMMYVQYLTGHPTLNRAQR